MAVAWASQGVQLVPLPMVLPVHSHAVCCAFAVAFEPHAVQVVAPAALMLLPVQSAHAAAPPPLNCPAEHWEHVRSCVASPPVAPCPG